MKKLVVIFIFTFVVVNSAYAHRPLATDDAGTVTKGHLQVEAGIEYTDEEEEGVTTIYIAPAYGILENLDFGFELPCEVHSEGEDGLGDISLVAKWRILDEQERFPAVTLKPSVKLATGDVGTGEVDWGLIGVLTKEIKPFVFHMNLGYTWVGVTHEDDVFNYGLAAHLPITEEFHLLGEITGETNSDPEADSDPLSVLFGFMYITPWGTIFDTAVSAGLTDASPDYTLTAGLTHEF